MVTTVYITPVMYIDPNGDSFFAILLFLIVCAGVTTVSALTYGAITDTPIILDLSVSIPIGAGVNVKFGISILFDFKNDNIQFYGHKGISMGGLKLGPSYSVGIIKNYENEGDYAGPFAFFGGSYYIGGDHCFDPRVNHSESVQAYSITFGWKGSSYFGYEEYFYWDKLTIRW